MILYHDFFLMNLTGVYSATVTAIGSCVSLTYYNKNKINLFIKWPIYKI